MPTNDCLSNRSLERNARARSLEATATARRAARAARIGPHRVLSTLVPSSLVLLSLTLAGCGGSTAPIDPAQVRPAGDASTARPGSGVTLNGNRTTPDAPPPGEK